MSASAAGAGTRTGSASRPFALTVLAALTGVPLAWLGLLTWARLTTGSQASAPVPAVLVVVLLAALAVLAARASRWRAVEVLVLVLMAPWVVGFLVLLAALGLGVVLLVPALPWIPALLAAGGARRDRERSASLPTLESRRRRARGWSVVLALGLTAAFVPLAWSAAQDHTGMTWSILGVTGRTSIWLLAAAVAGAVMVGSWVLVALVVRAAWPSAARAAAVIGILLAAIALLLSWTGLGVLALLCVPAALVMLHADSCRAASGQEATVRPEALVDPV